MPRKIALTDKQLLNELQSLYGVELTAADVKGFCASRSINYQTVTRRLEPFKTSRGKWNLEITQNVVDSIESSLEKVYLVPEKDPNYVPFGNFNTLKKIIKSGLFYPTFITGLSGNGKTFGV